MLLRAQAGAGRALLTVAPSNLIWVSHVLIQKRAADSIYIDNPDSSNDLD